MSTSSTSSSTSSTSATQFANLAVAPYPHQVEGIKWMIKTEKVHHQGGILADDMGLGKSFQTLGLIVNNPPYPPHNSSASARPFGTSLIILPLSLISQWKQEVATKLSVPLNVGVYHGSERKSMNFADYDIVLTTYACLSRDLDFESLAEQKFQKETEEHIRQMRHYEHLQKLYGKRKLQASSSSTKRFHPYLPPAPIAPVKVEVKSEVMETETATANLTKFNWYRVVLDECQQIKNIKSVTVKAAFQLKARFRWCLSGTPIQNKRTEFMSLYRFIMGRATNSVDRAIEEMEGKILRRTKDILDLPEKEFKEVSVKLSKEEGKVYREIEEDTKEKVYDVLHGGKMYKEMHHVLTLLLRLRQLCDHPQLVMTEGCPVTYSTKQQKILRILRDIRDKNGGKVVIFSIFVEMLRVLEGTLQKLGWDYAMFHGGMNMKQREATLDKFKTDDNCNILLMSTKAGSIGLNLVEASHVIITEIFWNPFVDDQAIDRVFRIGQEKDVKVYQLTVKDTIEDRILQLQKSKRAMFAEIFDRYGSKPVAGAGAGAGLSRHDIEYLFDLKSNFDFEI